MAPYCAQTPNESISEELQEQANYLDSTLQLVETFQDIRQPDGAYKVLVSRECGNDVTKCTWEPLIQLKESVPAWLRTYYILWFNDKLLQKFWVFKFDNTI